MEYFETAIGPRNTDFYLSRFQRFESGQGLISWNWPAFFISLIWLLYRKMWAYAAAYFFLPSIFYMVVLIILLSVTDEDSAAVGAVILYLGLIFLLFPMFANALYCRVVRKRIAKARGYATDRERQLRALASEGGTSNAVLILVLVLFVPVVGILAAIVIPAYQDYTIRAQVSEGLNLAAAAKAAVAETILTREEVPRNRTESRMTPNPTDTNGKYVRSVSVTNGRIDIRFGNEANALIADRILSITPYLDEAGSVFWRCGHAPVPAGATHEISDYDAGTVDARHLPSACRP